MTRPRSPLAGRVSLAYSAPTHGMVTPEPTEDSLDFWYNAMPELNDRASVFATDAAADRDWAPSRFPRRPKYLLTLDGLYVPAGEFVGREQLDADLIARLDDETLADLQAAIAQDPATKLPVPREPDYARTLDLQNDFELAHLRLTATSAIWRYRAFQLAPFYTSLEELFLHHTDAITVPLERDKGPVAFKFEQLWADVWGWAVSTQVLQEVTSLLVGLILADDDPSEYEPQWRNEHELELKGYIWHDPHSGQDHDFYSLYSEWQVMFPREEHEDDRPALAEAVVQHAASTLDRALPGPAPHLPQQDLESDRSALRPAGAWPDLLGVDGPRELFVDPKYIGGAPLETSIVATTQQLLALDAVRSHQHLSFHNRSAHWPLYHTFDLEVEDRAAYIVPRFQGHALEVFERAFRTADGGRVDRETSMAIARYTIFMESMRQQICSGVGLQCPYGDEPSCCGVFRSLLQRVAELTIPHPNVWPQHWHPPPCLS